MRDDAADRPRGPGHTGPRRVIMPTFTNRAVQRFRERAQQIVDGALSGKEGGGELRVVEERVRPLAEKVMREQGARVRYKFGTMIEIPRACVVADKIAGLAEFFSFGSNDLTQLVFGFSRDDAEGKFLLQYVNNKILPENPFQVLDAEGVGALIDMAVRLGRKARPQIELGICGEHGGDPASIEFCHKAGLTYVSCSPYRVPTARLAAAQAVLKEKQARSERDR